MNARARARIVALLVAAAVSVGAGYVVGLLAGSQGRAGQGVSEIFGTP